MNSHENYSAFTDGNIHNHTVHKHDPSISNDDFFITGSSKTCLKLNESNEIKLMKFNNN